MATTNPSSESSTSSAMPAAELFVLLSPMAPEQLGGVMANLSAAFPEESLLIATPDEVSMESYPALRIMPAPRVHKASWTLTAADFVNAYSLVEKTSPRGILILGPESASLSVSAVRGLAEAVLTSSTDLAIPCYDLPPRAGLVNSAILYPLTRALFACRARFPLAIDLCLSRRMAERMAGAGQRFTSLNQSDALVWPTHEAAVAGFQISEIVAGTRTLPQPNDTDLNAILALVAGSLFADVDAKAAYWQRARTLPPARNAVASSYPVDAVDAAADIAHMVDAFRLGYTNLREIWSLVLPPNTLLGLKRLAALEVAAFRMPENLWARIVFDFLLAYRLRTINRGHLLGALIPLYLAWVAGHINMLASGTDPERHIEMVAAAFEADKPYLVSRWRWPDRFNP